MSTMGPSAVRERGQLAPGALGGVLHLARAVLVCILGIAPPPLIANGAIAITEIQYHPTGGDPGLEWIELENRSAEPIDLSGWSFGAGIDFSFPAGFFLDGGALVLVARDAERIRHEFQLGEPVQVLGDWGSDCSGARPSGCRLDDDGELIELIAEDGVVEARVRYDDRGAWPAAADGTGHTLELRAAHAPLDDPRSWRASIARGGSPGRRNSSARTPAIRLSEFGPGAAESPWVEIVHTGRIPIDVSGWFLSGGRDLAPSHVFPSGTVVDPGRRLVVDAAAAGLDLEPASGPFVALVSPDSSVVDALSSSRIVPGRTVARVPELGAPGSPSSVSPHVIERVIDAATPTPGAPNSSGARTDVVLSEIFYHPPSDDPRDEFVEVHHRGFDHVDLSGWSLRGAVRFDFPLGASIAPSGYLVVGSDPVRLAERYELDDAIVFGPSSEETRTAFGRLSNSGERIWLADDEGRIVDEVAWADGGDWPRWADGGGSSLELIDPSIDNSSPLAWEASDESASAPIRRYTSTGRRHTRGESELRLILLDAGITIIDDVSVRRSKEELDVARTILPSGATWRALAIGGRETAAPADWTRPGFADSSWIEAITPAGYGCPVATTLDGVRGIHPNVLFRIAVDLDGFAEEAAAAGSSVWLEISYDDGFAAWLEGEAIGNANLPDGRRSESALALGEIDPRVARIDLGAHRAEWRDGAETIAIAIHNASISSPDLCFDARIVVGRLERELGPELVIGGDFESIVDAVPGDPGGLFIEGTHERSGRTLSRAISGRESFAIVASARGNNRVDRVEWTLPPLEVNADYEIGFTARWVTGSPRILVQGYDHSYPHTHILGVPDTSGTPGRPNSRARRGVGPMIDSVTVESASPRAGETVEITARISDPDGVDGITVRFAPDRPWPRSDARWQQVRIGRPDAFGVVQARLDGLAPGIFVLELEARDRLGNTTRFPRRASSETHPLLADPDQSSESDERWVVFDVENEFGERAAVDVLEPRKFARHELIIDRLSEERLALRRLHSNDLIAGTLVIDGERRFSDVGLRFAGSPFARRAWDGSYRVRIFGEERLLGTERRFNLDAHQGDGARDARERIARALLRSFRGSARIPLGRSDLVSVGLNEREIGERTVIAAPGSGMIDRYFPNDTRGHLYELDDRHVFSDQGTRVTSIDGRLLHPPYRSQAARLSVSSTTPELWRWYFEPRLREGLDDFAPILDLTRVLDPMMTSNAEFDAGIDAAVSVEEWLRVLVLRRNTDDWDTWGARRGKNAYFYRSDSDDRWTLIPWDQELTFGDPRAFLPAALDEVEVVPFPELERLLSRPRLRRLYLSLSAELADNVFSPAALAPYVDRLDAIGLTRTDVARAGGFIAERRRLLEERLGPLLSPKLGLEIDRIEISGSERRSVQLEGRAAIDIRRLAFSDAGEGSAAIDARIELGDRDPLSWSASFDVPGETRRIRIVGLDAADDAAAEIVFDVDPGAVRDAFVRGDADGNGRLALGDAIAILRSLFGASTIPCADAADVDDDGRISLGDGIALLEFLFRDGAAPAHPFPARGSDPSPDALDCDGV
jgi:hypothetical protein